MSTLPIQNQPQTPAEIMQGMPEHDRAIMGALKNFNQLRAFKFDFREAVEWKNSIMRVRPDLEVDQLRLAIDAMMDGRIEYDDKKGIRNIFTALKYVINDGEKWTILKQIF
jgi:hypothetical protein